ncbi:GNAT family N-acetyltransferase [Aquimarina aquimarini]|uniref:GNAT family N-acetyltransferase n=1 Tax=Aquimarina aquimarini TaxID=1191734 RepID=UPI000D557422|nr:GNAT family N-acetyltransferase [Aquimarina aquimarini]
MKRSTLITKSDSYILKSKLLPHRRRNTLKTLLTKPEITDPNNYNKNTFKNLLEDLQSVGISSLQFLNSLSNYELNDISEIIGYLNIVTNKKDYHPENLLLHYKLLSIIPSKHYKALSKFIKESYYNSSFSEDTIAFIKSEKITRVIDEVLFQYMGLLSGKTESLSKNINLTLRSKIRLLESIGSFLSEDPTIGIYFQKISTYGDLHSYYKNDKIIQEVLRKISYKGYDTDYIVFNSSLIQSIGPSKLEKQTEWDIRLLDIIKKILGGKNEKPEIDIKQNRNKLFNTIKEPYSLLKEKKDKNAALEIIHCITPALDKGHSILKKQDDFNDETQINNLKLELDYLKDILQNYDGELPKPRKLYATRSSKSLPELLFDNKRLSCCIFKPSGLFHGEITRLALNPTTPIIEFWLEPYQEFLGIATLYLGVNKSDQKTILVDTVEYDNRLLELRGNNGTMKFILNSIVIDAHQAGSKKVIVFAAPYGKPINFVNYIKNHREKQSSITYHKEYYFESVDPNNTALHSSYTSKHHYTVALGYNVPLKGIIDYGFTQVGINKVEKLKDGNTGVFEIDVDAFIKENKLTTQIPKKEKTSFYNPAMSIDCRPDYHEMTIKERKKEVIDEYTITLGKKISNPSIEIIDKTFDDALIDKLMSIEKSSFSNELRYCSDDIKKRLQQKASQILMIYENKTPIGFILSYISPYLPNDIIYLDTIGIIAEKQNLGLGQIVLQLYSKLSLFEGFSQIYVLTEKGNNSENLLKFYKKNGFEVTSNYSKSNSNLLIKSLSLKIPENTVYFDLLKKELVANLKNTIASPEVEILLNLDHNALQTVIDLEKEFDVDLRYNKEELKERSKYNDIFLAIIKDNNIPIASSLCYYDPSLLDHTIFFDTMCIRKKYQSKGIGKLIVKSMLRISKLSKYSQALFYCKTHSKEGINLIEFYKKLGARVVEVLETKTKMIFPVQ